jgi:membrane protein
MDYVGMGAAMTALLFTAGKFVIGYYIGKSGVASAYGPLRTEVAQG